MTARPEAYLARFARVNRPAWSFLTDEEWETIDRHVSACDFPEREARFASARELYCDPTGFYCIYRYDV